MKTAAIYSRKSKFTGKGESIENQIQLCKEYIKNHFELSDENILVYEDEGFSGGNTDRPCFQQMIKDAKLKKFDVLICYRLDRISRNVLDFSNTIEELGKLNVSFVSIREQFDTTTPMGRAMMYIASVFAQLERETIAERIRDNMLQLAKTGRWLGGITPTGFASEPVTSIDENGKQKKAFKLSPVPEELETVKLIFNKFLELKSLTKLETYCIQNNIRTKNGIDFSRFALRTLLTNPVYAVADSNLYDYLIENNYEVYSDRGDFDGKHAIMAYNKTIQKKNTSNKLRDSSEWIIAVGAHYGVISSDKWISVQNLLLQNKSKSFRKVRNSDALFSGLLRCGHCGSYMRPKAGRVNKDNIQTFYYMCEMKEKSRCQKCNIKNVNGNDLDKLIVNEMKELSRKRSDLHNKIKKDKVNIEVSQSNIHSEITLLESNIKSNEQAIANLVASLSENQNSSAAKYIIKQIEDLDEKTASLKNELNGLKQLSEANKLESENLSLMEDTLSTFSETFDSLDTEGQRALLKTIVEKITWDGKNVDISIFKYNQNKKAGT